MLRIKKQLMRGEKGQALPIVLALLAIGSLTVAVNLNYATVSVKGTGTIGENVKGIYAASAGLEYTLWSLVSSNTSPTQLSENVNGQAVGIQTVNEGTFTIVFGEMTEVSGSHNDWVGVSSTITATNVSGRYKYTITVTWQGDSSQRKLTEVGVRLPVDYSYVTGSAGSFPSNMDTGAPDVTSTDGQGAVMIKWQWNPGQGPTLSDSAPVKTQSFYTDGSGGQGGTYAWVVSQSSDVGTVGEITGTRYSITSTATRLQDGSRTAQIVADVLVQSDGSVKVASWRTAQ